MASSVNKNGLLYACIEGKHWTNRDLFKHFARVSGSEFINFEHLAVHVMQSGGRSLNHVYGMRIQAKKEVITCLDNGSISIEKRNLGDDYLYPEWMRR